MTEIRLFLADDHAMVRQAIADLLMRDPRFAVIGQAADGDALLQAARYHDWDITLLDLAMPGPPSERIITSLLELQPAQRVVALTMVDDVAVAVRLARAGLAGFLNKGAPFEELLNALLRIRDGERVLPAAVGRALRHPDPTVNEDPGLTDQEWRVLRLLCSDHAPADIARTLNVSRSTVSTHLRNIRDKLGVDTNAAIAAWAERNGLS